jgi:hypothetical protein
MTVVTVNLGFLAVAPPRAGAGRSGTRRARGRPPGSYPYESAHSGRSRRREPQPGSGQLGETRTILLRRLPLPEYPSLIVVRW